MKKLNFLYVIISLSILAFSCNKDDDPKVDPIVGKWDVVNIKWEVTNDQAAADTLNGFYSPYELFGAARIVLNIQSSDNTFEEIWYGLNGDSDEEGGKWEKKGTALTLKYDKSDDATYEISSVTESALKLIREESFTIKGKRIDSKFTYTYEK